MNFKHDALSFKEINLITAEKNCIMNVSEIAALNYPNSIRRRIKFFLRVLLYGKKPLSKIESIFNHPKLNRIIIENPSQYTKIFRPYLHHGLTINDRVSSIKNHHDFIKKHWNKKLINAVYCDKWMPLAEVAFDEQSHFFVGLQQCGGTQYENESEILVGLFGSKKIMSLCFNFTVDKNGEAGIFISSLQGSNKKEFPGLNEAIKNFTKKTGGMRPHAFLIFVLTVIASVYDLKKIQALRQDSHIKRKRIKTNFDAVWLDFGGELINNTTYFIPLNYERKSIEDIKANKRSMYKNRYKILNDVEQQIKVALQN